MCDNDWNVRIDIWSAKKDKWEMKREREKEGERRWSSVYVLVNVNYNTLCSSFNDNHFFEFWSPYQNIFIIKSLLTLYFYTNLRKKRDFTWVFFLLWTRITLLWFFFSSIVVLLCCLHSINSLPSIVLEDIAHEIACSHLFSSLFCWNRKWNGNFIMKSTSQESNDHIQTHSIIKKKKSNRKKWWKQLRKLAAR